MQALTHSILRRVVCSAAVCRRQTELSLLMHCQQINWQLLGAFTAWAKNNHNVGAAQTVDAARCWQTACALAPEARRHIGSGAAAVDQTASA